MEKTWVSDLITTEEIERWEPGSVITIRAKPGDGKSFFVKNKLYEYAKPRGEKILLLLHRENTVHQFQNEIDRDGKGDTVHVRTYQYFEQALLYGRESSLAEYRYIVVDEAHYFISDSAFNDKTDISFDGIMRQTGSVRIFMSATIDDIQYYLNVRQGIETTDYCIKQEYRNIEKLTFFSKDDMLDEFADRKSVV